MTDIENFIEELTALTVKHKIGIGGCGHCGSPFIFHAIGDGEIIAENLDWDLEQEKYTIIPSVWSIFGEVCNAK